MSVKLVDQHAIVSLIFLRNMISFSQDIPKSVQDSEVTSATHVSVDIVRFGSGGGTVNILFSTGWGMPHLKNR